MFEDLDSRIDCILQGEATEIGLESTVVDCTSDVPLILRSGAVTLEDLRKIVPETEVYQLKENESPKSPGLKHKHYAPQAKVVLVQDSRFKIQDSRFKIQDSEIRNQKLEIGNPASKAFIGLSEPFGEFGIVKICGSVAEYAHEVFAFFRECDALKIKTIECEIVEEKGIGTALMDRLKRAAED